MPLIKLKAPFVHAKTDLIEITRAIARKNLQSTIQNYRKKVSSARARRRARNKSIAYPLRGYRKSQEIGKCLINTLKMALNLRNKKYYMASLYELTIFSSSPALNVFRTYNVAVETFFSSPPTPFHQRAMCYYEA